MKKDICSDSLKIETASLCICAAEVVCPDEAALLSTEHVINVLGRLQAQPLPETVQTILQVSQTPLADTARYDSLTGCRCDDRGGRAGHCKSDAADACWVYTVERA